MTAALLKAMLRRYLGRLLVLVVVGIFVAAVMGFIDWVGVVALWVLVLIVALTHSSVNDVDTEDGDR